MQFGTPRHGKRKKGGKTATRNIYNALAEDKPQEAQEPDQAEDKVMFTPAYGSKSRRNVSAAIISMQTSNAQAASYLATILETRPKDGTLDFPMADQATQTKVVQAFLGSFTLLIQHHWRYGQVQPRWLYCHGNRCSY